MISTLEQLKAAILSDEPGRDRWLGTHRLDMMVFEARQDNQTAQQAFSQFGEWCTEQGVDVSRSTGGDCYYFRKLTHAAGGCGVSSGLTIWQFEDAPEPYRKLSGHGGDEDWVLYCPAALTSVCYWPLRVESAISSDENSYLDGFGHVDRHVLDNGDVVVIFAHA